MEPHDGRGYYKSSPVTNLMTSDRIKSNTFRFSLDMKGPKTQPQMHRRTIFYNKSFS
jgi:hypothetical protein